MVELNQFQYYFRWYPFLTEKSLPLWWYNHETGEIKYHDTMFPEHDGDSAWTPLSKVDMVALEQAFLREYGLERIISKLSSISGSDFDREFRKYIDGKPLARGWHQYESERLRAEAIAWCHVNRVRYKA